MTGLLKDIIIDFILFSGIEGLIFCLFFRKIFNCKKFKPYQWFLIAFGNCIISKVLPPVVYQLFMIIWIAFILYIFKFNKNIFNCLKMSGLSLCMFLITEIVYSILLEKFVNFESLTFLTDLEELKLFVLIIPLRIFEIINIFIVKEIMKMKVIIGGVVRK